MGGRPPQKVRLCSRSVSLGAAAEAVADADNHAAADDHADGDDHADVDDLVQDDDLVQGVPKWCIILSIDRTENGR